MSKSLFFSPGRHFGTSSVPSMTSYLSFPVYEVVDLSTPDDGGLTQQSDFQNTFHY
jgi:hypothetical protein